MDWTCIGGLHRSLIALYWVLSRNGLYECKSQQILLLKMTVLINGLRLIHWLILIEWIFSKYAVIEGRSPHTHVIEVYILVLSRRSLPLIISQPPAYQGVSSCPLKWHSTPLWCFALYQAHRDRKNEQFWNYVSNKHFIFYVIHLGHLSKMSQC